MNKLATHANKFIKEYIKFFNLEKGENLTSLDCSSHLTWLKDKLFTCRFLYECMDTGIGYHQNWLEYHKEEIAKKIEDDEVPKIIENFKELIKNKDLILILSYEFFINYLAAIVRETFNKNTYLLKDIKEVNYKGFELVDKITKDPNIILEDLVNLIIFGDKQEGNLKTIPDFWIEILEEKLKIKLSDEMRNFWNVFHIRRNASSHMKAKNHWDKVSCELLNIDPLVWLYGLMFLAYTIDSQLCQKYKIESKEIKFNFSGEPIYNLQKLSL